MAEEKLAGDITADIIKAVRLDRVGKLIGRTKSKNGQPCHGCKHRKEKLNALHRKLREAKSRREDRIAKALGTDHDE